MQNNLEGNINCIMQIEKKIIKNLYLWCKVLRKSQLKTNYILRLKENILKFMHTYMTKQGFLIEKHLSQEFSYMYFYIYII